MIKESTICNEKVHVKKQSLLHDSLSFEIVVLELQLCNVDDELDRRREGPSYASDSTDEEDNGQHVREVQTPAKKPPPRTPAKPPAKQQSKSPHVRIPPSPGT